MTLMMRITAPHFCAGIEPQRRSAPIIRYMLRWSVDEIERHCKIKGWRVEYLDSDSVKSDTSIRVGAPWKPVNSST